MRAAGSGLPSCLVLAFAVGIALAGCRAPDPPPNLVVVVMDTVRADRLSCYGYRRPTTPHVDALAAQGIRFANASSTSSWTLPSHASLFTGRFPIEHGATQEHTSLGPEHATLAELLSGRGYATFGTSANAVVSEKSGLARGFDRFAEAWRGARAHGVDPEQHPNLLALRRFLAERPPERPFFVFANYVEAHVPYDPPEPWRSRFLRVPAESPLVAAASRRRPREHYLDPAAIPAREFQVISDLYDGDVAHVDALVGAFVDALRRAGALENTVLVVTSDHGENLGDHGHFAHVFSLYRTTVRVPLVIVLPGGRRAGEVVDEPVSLIDVTTTLLSLAGAETPAGLAGRDLLSDLAGSRAPIYAEYYYPQQALTLFGPDAVRQHGDALGPYLRRLRSVETGGLRLIWSSDGRRELYNLADDPDERRDVADETWLAERERRLQALLDDYVARAGGPTPLPGDAEPPGGAFGDLDDETAERLRELGYIP